MHLSLSREEVESPMLTPGQASGKEWHSMKKSRYFWLLFGARKPGKLPRKAISDLYLRPLAITTYWRPFTA